MTDPGGIDLSHERPVEQAGLDESVPSGAPMEYTNVVWEKMSPADRAAYEREHGIQPPGYRGTGPVEWFARHHPDLGQCVSCGLVTDRWEIRRTWVGDVAWGSPHVDQQMPTLPASGDPATQEVRDKLTAICGVMVPFCDGCQRLASILVLEIRQQNPAILVTVRAREAMTLAALKAEQALHDAEVA